MHKLRARVGCERTGFLVILVVVSPPWLALLYTSIRTAIDGSLNDVWLPACLAILWLLLVDATARAMRGTRIVVGQEGVFIQPRRGGSNFVFYAKLRAVEKHGYNFALTLACDTERITVEEQRTKEHEALAAAIEQAWQAWQQQPPAETIDALRCGDAPRKSWRDELRALGSGRSRYREAVLEPARLRQIVASPTASPEQRVGAALVLSSGPDAAADAKETVRAAQGCAHPKLRVALEKAARGLLPTSFQDDLEELEVQTRAEERAASSNRIGA